MVLEAKLAVIPVAEPRSIRPRSIVPMLSVVQPVAVVTSSVVDVLVRTSRTVPVTDFVELVAGQAEHRLLLLARAGEVQRRGGARLVVERVLRGLEGAELRDVGAGSERLVPRAGQDHHDQRDHHWGRQGAPSGPQEWGPSG